MNVVKTLAGVGVALSFLCLPYYQVYSQPTVDRPFIQKKQFKKIGNGFDCRFWNLKEFEGLGDNVDSNNNEGKTIYPNSKPMIIKLWSGERVPFGSKYKIPIFFDPDSLITAPEGVGFQSIDEWPKKYVFLWKIPGQVRVFSIDGSKPVSVGSNVYPSTLLTRVFDEKISDNKNIKLKDAAFGKCTASPNISFGDFDGEGNLK